MHLSDLQEIIASGRYPMTAIARALGYKNMKRDEILLKYLPFIDGRARDERYLVLLNKLERISEEDIQNSVRSSGKYLSMNSNSEHSNKIVESDKEADELAGRRKAYDGKLSISASAFSRALECPSSVFLKSTARSFRGSQAKEAKVGEDIHKVLEVFFKKTSVQEQKRLMRVSSSKELKETIDYLFSTLLYFFIDAGDQTKVDLIEDVKRNFIAFLRVFKGFRSRHKDLVVYSEKDVRVDRQGMKLRGIADLIILNERKKEAFLVDFKTGFRFVSAFQNMQLYFLGHLCVLSGLIPSHYDIRGVILNLSSPSLAVSSGDMKIDVKAFDRKLGEIWSVGENKFNVGSYCTYCPVLLSCPEARKIVKEITSKFNIREEK